MISLIMWLLTAGTSVVAFIAGGQAWRTTRRREQTTAFLHGTGRALLAARDLDRAAVGVLHRACSQFAADWAVLELFPPIDVEGVAFRTTVRHGRAIEVMRSVDPDDDSDLPAGMVAEMRYDGRSVGRMLITDRSAKGAYSERDRRLFKSFADLIAFTLERSRLHEALVRVCALQNELADRVFHDPLTLLPNRVLFIDRIEQALVRRDAQRGIAAVVCVSVEEFGQINAKHGHAIGDAVLIEVAGRLRSCLRRSDTAARLGGNDFALLLVELLQPHEAELIASRVRESLNAPATVGSTTIALRSRVGLACAKADQSSAALLLRNAAIAMGAAPNDDTTLAAELAAAIARDELVLHFQPIVELPTGKILGAEALVRWFHPVRGLIAPMRFLPAAAECGLAESVEAHILRRACQQVRRWQDAHQSTPPLAVSVNVSATELFGATFVETLTAILDETGVNPASLILEVTENAVLEDLAGAIVRFDSLQRLGVHVAIDDVGTGYTSLAYLRRLPIDILKIAKPLVAELADPNSSGKLARTVVRHGQALRLALVAEGVEGAIQVRRLTELGCAMAQGFHLARPCDAAGMEALLLEGALDQAAYSAPPVSKTRSQTARRPGDRPARVRSRGAAARNPA
jgi:diguanylate cyclase (GGDEF)-like protein